jgi:hypothetical protein
VRRLAAAAAGLLAVAACGGADTSSKPIVDQIDDAISAFEQHYGAPQQYFEISANLEGVNVIVAVDGATAAEQGAFSADGGLIVPEPVGPASGSTFASEAVTFDPDVIFDQIRDELDDPVIVDFAIRGTATGSVIYDATVASDAGGVLLVLLGPTGQILGAQAQ